MSGDSNIQRLRNYINEKTFEIYSEQTPGTQKRMTQVGNRMRKLNKKHNPIKKINAPKGKDIIKRILVGEASSITEVLDGVPKQKRASSEPRKKRTRKSRVVE